MFVTNVEIRKQASYEPDAGQFRATIMLEGPTGKQEILLSAAAISKIFGVISQEVIERSRSNAAQVKAGMEEAIYAPLVLQSANVGGQNDIPF